MSFANINKALVEAYDGLGLGLATAYEGRDFNPVQETAWSRVSNVPAPVTIASMGRRGEDEHIGLFNVELFYPTNKGIGDMLEKADEVASEFVAGKRYYEGALCVLIRSCSRSQVERTDGWLKITISASYQARTTRPEI